MLPLWGSLKTKKTDRCPLAVIFSSSRMSGMCVRGQFFHSLPPNPKALKKEKLIRLTPRLRKEGYCKRAKLFNLSLIVLKVEL